MTSVLISKLDGVLAKTKIELKTCDTAIDEKVGLDFQKVSQRGYCTKSEIKRKAIIRTYSKENLIKSTFQFCSFFQHKSGFALVVRLSTGPRRETVG